MGVVGGETCRVFEVGGVWLPWAMLRWDGECACDELHLRPGQFSGRRDGEGGRAAVCAPGVLASRCTRQTCIEFANCHKGQLAWQRQTWKDALGRARVRY